MYLTYDELTELVPLVKAEKALDTIFLNSANEYIEKTIGNDFADYPDSLKNAILVVFNDRKDWYRKFSNAIESGQSTLS